MVFLEMKEIYDTFLFRWHDPDLQILIDHIRNENDAIRCEIIVEHRLPGAESSNHLLWDTWNLSSVRSRNSLAKDLESELNEVVDWIATLETVRMMLRHRVRQGEAFIEVGMGERIKTQPRWRLYPLIPEAQPTLLFGDGDAGKSYLASLIGLLCLNGQKLLGFEPLVEEDAHFAYLDYETDDTEIDERIFCLAAGLNIPPFTFHYQRRSTPIAQSGPELRRYFAQNNIKVAIIDSAAGACGDDITQEKPVSAMFSTLRSLGTTNIIIGHIAKNEIDKKDANPYGAVFWRNWARASWLVRSEKEPKNANAFTMGLYQRKRNNSRYFHPIGLHWQFVQEGDQLDKVIVKRTDLREVPELADGVPLRHRIAGLLARGSRTVQDLATELEKTPGHISKELSSMKKDGEVTNMTGGVWGLVT